MKKTLAAVAVLGAFAGSALAADVQLYGIIDTGLAYVHGDADGLSQDFDSFSMESGQGSGSRWGIKGTEDLGNVLRSASSLKTESPPMTALIAALCSTVNRASSCRVTSVRSPSVAWVLSTTDSLLGLGLA